MRSQLIETILIFFLVNHINGAPTVGKFQKYQQSNNSQITLCKIGDEYLHYYTTTDGLQVLKAENGGFYYAMVSDKTIKKSSQLAHDSIDRKKDEENFIKSLSKDISKHISKIWGELRNDNMSQAAHNMKRAKGVFGSTQTYIGHKKGLVILVDFANKSMNGESSNSDFDRMFNENGYSEDNHIGSVHEYFYDQSFGLFDLTFDVVGPIKLSNNYGYYGQNLDEFRGDKRAGTMVIEACKAVDDIVDFRNYDWDNDGIVETVYIVYAGYGENTSDDSTTIWPHKSSLSGRAVAGDGEGALTLDNVTIDVYACSSELAGATGTNRNGIGTACHEFSHCLGLPDLYDTDYSGAFGMNKWDIMDSGSYSGPNERGEIPYGYSAFERAYVGWMNIDKLESDCEYMLPPLNDYPNAYMLSNEGDENELFIIENHQSDKWFSYVGKHTDIHGMMITHIDYNESAWKKNTVNSSPKHMRQSIVPADKSYGSYNSTYKFYDPSEADYRGDLFPGINNSNRFSSKEYEKCGGKLFNINTDRTYNVNLNIDNITENEGVIFFTAGEPVDKPNIVSVTQLDDKLEIKWTPVLDIEEYILELTKIKSILPSRVEKETIEGIFDTSYVVDDIKCKQCVVKVKAKNKYVSSEWSEQVKVSIDSNAVSTLSEDQSEAEFYTIDGIKCFGLPQRGLHFVKQNGKFKKIFVR